MRFLILLPFLLIPHTAQAITTEEVAQYATIGALHMHNSYLKDGNRLMACKTWADARQFARLGGLTAIPADPACPSP